jgi:carbamoyltransferase
MRDGRIEMAVQEERLSRVKNDEGFPIKALGSIIERTKLAPGDISRVAIAGTHGHLEAPIFFYLGQAGSLGGTSAITYKILARLAGMTKIKKLKHSYFNKDKYLSFLRDRLAKHSIPPVALRLYDHHTCHAASAYYGSPFDEALVITQDGRGDLLSGGAWLASKDGMTNIYKQGAEDSLAQLYALVTRHLGFKPLRHEGKITGLAAYGRPTGLGKEIMNFFKIMENGQLKRKDSGIEQRKKAIIVAKATVKERQMIEASPEEYRGFNEFGLFFNYWLNEAAALASREDVSYAIQWATEEVMVKSLKNLIASQSQGSEDINLCLAGGLFANVRVNQRMREASPQIRNVYIHPAMGDAGLAVGAAYLADQEMQSLQRRPEIMAHVYLGDGYGDEQIEATLRTWPNRLRYERCDNLEQAVAQQVAAGAIVGLFQGRMEFGPRALGNRSILIRPTHKAINNEVNKRLRRTEFMPFAPSVLDYRASDYFEGYSEDHVAAEFMTITYNVRPEKQDEIQAVVHVDGTARPQVVKKQNNRLFYGILQEYEKLTGIGCLVNTSFNMHEEPIIRSPEDALRAFDQNSVDLLCIGSFLVNR